MDIDLDTKLKLFKGSTFYVDEIAIKPLTVGEIIESGYSNYLKQLNIFALDVEDIVEDVPEEYKEVTTFDLFIGLGIPELLDAFVDAIKYFLKPNSIDIILNNIVVDEKAINRNNWDEIKNIILMQNNIKKETYNPANKKAKEIIEKIKKNKKNAPVIKQNNDFFSIVSGLAWKSNSINAINIFDLNIYSFYDGLNRLNLIDDYEYTLTGIYTGNVDAKKINLKDLSWFKIIDI